jgi:hypothetical protein
MDPGSLSIITAGIQGDAHDFMRLLLGFWDTPVPSAGATPVKRQQQRFHRAGGAGRFPQMKADLGVVGVWGRWHFVT